MFGLGWSEMVLVAIVALIVIGPKDLPGMFRTMGQGEMDLGSSISLALLATLYGVAFGAGVAGPIGHYLRNLLDERLGALERCEQSVFDLVSRSGRASGRS